MGKRKKIILGVIAYLIMLCCIHAGEGKVKADVIWRPVERFYDEHYDELERVVDYWITNSKNGYVTLYKNPESKRIVTYIENGTELLIRFIYTDSNGKQWGIVGKIDGTFEELKDTGWIEFDECVRPYNNLEFRKDHKLDIIEKKINFNPTKCSKSVIIWDFPYCGEINIKIDPTSSEADKMYRNFQNVEYEFYTADDGAEWVYYMGFEDYHNNGWICITDPYSEEMKVDEKILYEKYPAKKPPLDEETLEKERLKEQTYEKHAPNHIVISVILVIVVVGVTAVVIRCMFRKEENSMSESLSDMKEKNDEDK